MQPLVAVNGFFVLLCCVAKSRGIKIAIGGPSVTCFLNTAFIADKAAV